MSNAPPGMAGPGDPPYPDIDYQTVRTGSTGPGIYRGEDSAIQTTGRMSATNMVIVDENGNTSSVTTPSDLANMKTAIAELKIAAEAARLIMQAHDDKFVNLELRIAKLEAKP